MKPTAQQIRQLRRDNARWPVDLAVVPAAEWVLIGGASDCPRIEVFRSRDFMVQVFAEPRGVLRLSVQRTDWDERQGRFREHISWDELQSLKRQAGYGDRWAVEIYPDDREVVNVANMRHLWLLPVPPSFAWQSGRQAEQEAA